jgi:hypothetical protein
MKKLAANSARQPMESALSVRRFRIFKGSVSGTGLAVPALRTILPAESCELIHGPRCPLVRPNSADMVLT